MKKIYTFLLFSTIYFQSFSQWIGDAANGGIAICNATTDELGKLSVTDGSNGAIIIFTSRDKSNTASIPNIYAQRVSSSGQLQWGASSSPKGVSTATTGDKELQNAIPDESGGAYVSWVIYRTIDDSSELYLQHLNSSGNPLWSVNGIKVNAANNREVFNGQLARDGAGGVIISWTESVYDNITNLTTYAQAFAQKYNSTGIAQWTNGGVQLCTAPGLTINGSMIDDGSGGIIISLTDSRNSNHFTDDTFDNLDVYAQRLSSNGARMWTNNGVAVNTESFNQLNLLESFPLTRSGISDGNGGMIFLFDDYTGNNDGNGNIFTQRINSSGTRQWAAAGVPVCTTDTAKNLAKMLSDGAGGTVVFWSNYSNGGSISGSYYTQRILSNGTPNWTINGVKLFESGYYGGDNDIFDVTDDGAGNYSYVWRDVTFSSLRAQKINNSAAAQWGTNGKDICTNTDASPIQGQVINSDAGQLIVNWNDNRNYQTSGADIYAAKLTTTGDLIGGVVSTSFITATNGNWNTPSTWLGGVVPTNTSDCIVRHNVTVSANATCKSLRVEKPNGSVTVSIGINITVLQ